MPGDELLCDQCLLGTFQRLPKSTVRISLAFKRMKMGIRDQKPSG